MESKTDIQLQNDRKYQADRLRNAYDIRNKDPNTLTIYQKEQLKRFQEVTKEVCNRYSKF